MSDLIPCPCGCSLLTTGTQRCEGCGRDISLAHWDGIYDSCGDCADWLGEFSDNPRAFDEIKADRDAWIAAGCPPLKQWNARQVAP